MIIQESSSEKSYPTRDTNREDHTPIMGESQTKRDPKRATKTQGIIFSNINKYSIIASVEAMVVNTEKIAGS